MNEVFGIEKPATGDKFKEKSTQGLRGKKDFPKLMIRVPDDAHEMSTSDDW